MVEMRPVSSVSQERAGILSVPFFYVSACAMHRRCRKEGGKVLSQNPLALSTNHTLLHPHTQRVRFVIQYCQRLQKNDFIMKNEDFSANRKGQREYLNDSLTHGLVRSLNEYFHSKVEIPRIRMGKKQEIETLINEEAFLLAHYLRDEHEDWSPRIAM
jgi:hypothetical protein